MILLYGLVFLAAAALTVLCTLVLGRAAPRLGLLDVPDARKAHARTTPVVGGIAIVAGLALTVVPAAIATVPAETALKLVSNHAGYLMGVLLLVLVGAIDDRLPIPARYKLLVQLIACTLVVFVDRTVIGDIGVNLGGMKISLGGLAPPFTVLVMLTIANAYNMIDGVDGLAGGITLVGLALMAKAVIAARFLSDALFMMALTGALSAFLVFNFPLLKNRPARVFLGDAGSLFLGFTLAYLTIELSSLPFRVFKPSTALWFFFIPVVDTIWLYLRRSYYGRTPFAPGRDHIHHLLLQHFDVRTTTWILTGASALLGGGAYLAERLGVWNLWPIAAFVVAFLLYGAVTHKAWRAAWVRSRKDDPVFIQVGTAG